ncbi:MAG: hypothetical protein HQ472_00330 [Ignavibacteria bacterium]|nr:hypothetical protein [Ignavibacteria bacterium]
MTYFKRLLLVVPFLLAFTVAIGLSVPPVPGFAVDVQPRICGDEVLVTVVNSNLAVGGVQNLAIVSVNGMTMEDIKPRITQREGLQEITVQTKEWGRGMYVLVVSDNMSQGIIKILKLN